MAYEISSDERSIKCLQCGVVSYNSSDVCERYCARCHMFHDEYVHLGKDVSRPKTPFVVGEWVQRVGGRYVVMENCGFFGRVKDEVGTELFPFFWFSEGEWCERARYG